MRIMRIQVCLFLPVLGIGVCAAIGVRVSGEAAEENAAAEGEWGSITGQFLVEGEVPKRKLLVQRGDADVKDAAICAADDILSDAVVIDPKTKGIANIFI